MSATLKAMLDEAKNFKGITRQFEVFCVRIVQQMLAEEEHHVIYPPSAIPEYLVKTWNKNRTKYERLVCGGCLKELPVRTIAWLTVGEKPRCLD